MVAAVENSNPRGRILSVESLTTSVEAVLLMLLAAVLLLWLSDS